MERDYESTDVEGAAHLAAEEAEPEEQPTPAEIADEEREFAAEQERLRRWADTHVGGGYEG